MPPDRHPPTDDTHSFCPQEIDHERLRHLVENVRGVLWEEWFDHSPSWVSRAVEEMLGYTREEFLAHDSFLELVHPEDREAVRRRAQEAIATRSDFTQTFRAIARGGRIVWCEAHCSMILDEDGEPIGMRGISFDVTSRVETEARLRERDAIFQQIAELSPVLLWLADEQVRLTFISRGLLDLVGIAGEDQLGYGWLSSIHPDDRERVEAVTWRAVETMNRIRYECRFTGRDGEEHNLLVDGIPRLDESGKLLGYVGSATDLTLTRQLERSFAEEKRIAGLGRLSATIAHEMNNVLMGIQPFAELIGAGAPPEIVERAGVNIRASVARGRRITHDILQLGSGVEPQLEPIEVREWLASCAVELGAILGSSIDFRIEAEEGVRIMGDPAQLQQVLGNLASNARDAMAEGGVFRIAVTSAPYTTEIGADAVRIEVSDTGCGMDDETKARIFEPLFTSKRSGLGLGLPLVYDIIRRHHGELVVDSTPGVGTKFTIYLHATDLIPAAERAVEKSIAPSTIRRILLVEDEELVATGIAAILELDGHEVRIASTGAAAMEALREFEPDAVILDVGLPDISGTRVFEMIRAGRPELPVIFSTGHTGKVELQQYLAQPKTRHLLKPYEVSDLIAALESVTSED
ncbi:MAG: PAS domain-containing protein [Thermoanaerobaculia bacterium]